MRETLRKQLAAALLSKDGEDSPPPISPVPYQLCSNSTLDEMIAMLETSPVDLIKQAATAENISQGFISSQLRDWGHLKGWLIESHVRSLLAVMADQNDKIGITPIPHGTATRNYYFRTDCTGQYEVWNIDGPFQSIVKAEYDALTLIDGLPTIWEVKSYGMDRKSVRPKFKKALLETTIASRTEPVVEYFRSPLLAYVVTTHRSDRIPQNNLSTLLEDFAKRGGHLATLPITKAEISDQLAEVESTYISRS